MGDSVLVRAVFKFKGTNNDELKFKKGDIITITQKEDGGWWEGTLDGKTGWFPSNYVEDMPRSVMMEIPKWYTIYSIYLNYREGNSVAAAPDPVPEDVIAKNIDYRQQVYYYCRSSSGLRSLFTGVAWSAGKRARICERPQGSTQSVLATTSPCWYVSTLCIKWFVSWWMAKYYRQNELKSGTYQQRIPFQGYHKTTDWSTKVLKRGPEWIFPSLAISSLHLIMRKDS